MVDEEVYFKAKEEFPSINLNTYLKSEA